MMGRSSRRRATGSCGRRATNLRPPLELDAAGDEALHVGTRQQALATGLLFGPRYSGYLPWNAQRREGAGAFWRSVLGRLALCPRLGLLRFPGVASNSWVTLAPPRLDAGAVTRPDGSASSPAASSSVGDGGVVARRPQLPALYAGEDRPIITGEYLQDAKATRDPLTNQSVVNFVLSRRGGRIFERETGRHVNDYMAIILDGRVQGQPPVIKSRSGSAGRSSWAPSPCRMPRTSPWCSRRGRSPRRSHHRRAHHRAIARPGLDQGRHPCRDRGGGARRADHGGYYGCRACWPWQPWPVRRLHARRARGFGFTLTLPGLAGLALSVGIAWTRTC